MIVERYLFKELATTLLAVIVVLFLIFVSSWFARLLGQVASGSVQIEMIFWLLALKSLDALTILLPLALYIAVLLAFGRLYRDSEMAAMAACGIGLGRMLRFLLWFTFGFALIIASISLYFGPTAKAQRYQIQKEMDSASGLDLVAAGRFREMAGGQVVFYAERLSDDGESMENIFIHSQGEEGQTYLMVADSGYRHRPEGGSGQFLVLVDGYRYEGVPGSVDFRIIRFKEHAVLIKEREITVDVDEVSAIASSVLWRSDKPWEIAELQWRLSLPLSAITMSLVALFLSKSNPRQGRYGKVFGGILVYVVYSNLMGVARSWVEKGIISPLIGVWWVHLLLIILVALMWMHYMGRLSWRSIVSPAK